MTTGLQDNYKTRKIVTSAAMTGTAEDVRLIFTHVST